MAKKSSKPKIVEPKRAATHYLCLSVDDSLWLERAIKQTLASTGMSDDARESLKSIQLKCAFFVQTPHIEKVKEKPQTEPKENSSDNQSDT